MGRSLLGVLAGFVVAVVVIMVVEMVGMKVYPLPAGVDPTDPAALQALMPTLPLGSFLFVLASWLLGTGAGAVVAQRVSKAASRVPGLTLGGLVLAAALYNMWVIPHPTWFVAASVFGIAAVAALASKPHAAPAAGA
ncbi:MAG TPA: hypothetical protein PK948_05835 [Gemmatimonadales bacterium]|jgi:hypothetical protein|nr:hypothetical protein [Gemmatimonadales bacterium]